MSKARNYHEAIDALNPRQREAFLHEGNVALLAGPGSGKTATLVLKVARLLDQVPAPRGVACLTYANEAAREFERRLRALGVRGGSRLYTGTVHAFCLANVLRPFGYRLDAGSRHLATAEIATDDEVARARQKGLDAAEINEPEMFWSSKLSEYRRLALVDPALGLNLDERLPQVSRAYDSHLRGLNRIDFDDVVTGALHLVEGDALVRRALAAKFPWFVIDEYQDLGLGLHRMMAALIDRAGVRVFAVGDPDQSIYGFAGARPEFLEQLAGRPDVRRVRLEMNYRCAQRIIDASLHVLQPETEREFRAASADRLGEVFFKKRKDLNGQAEYVRDQIQLLLASGVRAGRIGVFAKRHDDLRVCEAVLSQAAVPHRIVRFGGWRETRLTGWIADMTRWCATHGDPTHGRMSELFRTYRYLSSASPSPLGLPADLGGAGSFYRLLRELRQPTIALRDWTRLVDAALGFTRLDPGVVPSSLRHDVRELHAMLRALAGELGDQTIAEFCGIDGDRVALQTLHGSKGLEYEAVFMVALEEGVLPAYRSRDLREDRRIFYVGITRAEAQVHLLFSGHFMNSKGQVRDMGYSRFIPELWKRLHPEGR